MWFWWWLGAGTAGGTPAVQHPVRVADRSAVFYAATDGTAARYGVTNASAPRYGVEVNDGT